MSIMARKTDFEVIRGGKMNLREKILNAEDIQEQIVDVPEWGVKILVRGLDGEQRARVMQNGTDSRGNVNFTKIYPDILIATCYDPETKERVFEETDRDLIMKKSSAAIDKVVNVAMSISGLSKQAEEVIEKN